MSDLKDAIRSVPSWESKTDTELLAAVQAIAITTTDATLRSYDGVGEILGFEASIALQATIEGLIESRALGDTNTAVLKAAHTSLVQGRMNFSLPFIQAKLEEFRAVPPLASFVDGLKGIGVRTAHPWAGVTLEDIQQALETIEAEDNAALLQAQRSAIASVFRNLPALLEQSDLPTKQSALDYITANWPNGVA